MVLLLSYLFIAVFFSFLCSVSEAVLLSITPTYVGGKIKEGRPFAIKLERLKHNVDRPLSAILTLNTFAHTIGAAGVGAQAQIIWGEEYLSLVSVLVTIAILVFSEIIPKVVGATYWRQLAPVTTYTVNALIIILYPFVWISQLITRLLKSKKAEVTVTRADFSAMAEIGSKEGSLHNRELALIKNVMKFGKVKVKDIMTPRNVMIAFQEDILLKDIIEEVHTEGFSRIPVFKENVDDITGFVLKDEIFKCLADDKDEMTLHELRRDALFVREEVPISVLFRQLIDRKEHIAIATEEYGGTAGLVTMEDILETILGMEIMDELDDVQDMQQYAKDIAWRSQRQKVQKDKE